MVKKLNLPVILVSRYYLGSINHTLLSVAALKQWEIPVAGIIFNGKLNQSSKEIILKQTQLPLIGEISEDTPPSKEMVLENTQNIHL